MEQQLIDDKLKEVIEKFAMKAYDRINKGIFTSEDNLRYLFYMTYVRKMGIDDNDVVLEARYRDFDLKNKLKYEDTFKEIKGGSSHLELDALMLPNIAMEFKYHKDRLDSPRQTHAKTHRAGSLINDFNRLSTLDKYNGNSLRKFAVYVYESKMDIYYQHGHGIENVFRDLKESNATSFDPNKSYSQKTIQEAAFESFKDNTVLSRYQIKLFKKVDIKGKLFVRVFEIE